MGNIVIDLKIMDDFFDCLYIKRHLPWKYKFTLWVREAEAAPHDQADERYSSIKDHISVIFIGGLKKSFVFFLGIKLFDVQLPFIQMY